MFFICKDVNVYNYEYHYHSQPPVTPKKHKLPSPISILTLKNNKHAQEPKSSQNK